MAEPGAILIAGPTASGKSGAALAVAQELGGAVINADSMQVYRELRVLTARPTPTDETAAPIFCMAFVRRRSPIRREDGRPTPKPPWPTFAPKGWSPYSLAARDCISGR